MPAHPVYGSYEKGFKVIPGYRKYEVNEFSDVRHIENKRILSPSGQYQVTIMRDDSTPVNLRVYHLALLSFFPYIERKPTVDHIDENHANNFIENIPWATYSENTRKSIALRPRTNGVKRMKPVELVVSSDNTRIFHSAYDAQQRTGVSAAAIRKCCGGFTNNAGGFTWRYSFSQLPGEVWTSSSSLKEELSRYVHEHENVERIMVSNMGRIRSSFGVESFGCKVGRYRRYSNFYVHILVWLGWKGPIPDGLQVLHDDRIPLDADGCDSNAIEHLKIGTQSQNIRESVQYGRLGEHARKRRKMY